MPDDVSVAEQVEQDPAFDKSFNAKPEVENQEEQPGGGQEPEKKPEPPDKDKGQEQAPEVKPEPTAQEKLEARAGERVKEDEPSPAPQAQPPPPANLPVPPAATAPAEEDGLFKDLPGLDDAKIEVDGKSVPLKEFAAEYPEVAQASRLIGEAAARKVLEEAVQQGQLLTSESAEAQQVKLANMEFWQGLSEKHADARKIATSKEFWGWMEKQSRVVQALGASLDPEDGAAVMDAYKESLAKSEKEKADKAAADKKTARDDLHKGTLREKKTAEESAGGGGKDDDFDSGFNSVR